MEDIFKFLFVIGIIAIGFVRQARKEADNPMYEENGPAMPMRLMLKALCPDKLETAYTYEGI